MKFTEWVLDKILTFKGAVFSGADNAHPVFLDGDATVYDDKAYQLIGRRLSSSVGRVDYDWNEQAVIFQNNGDIANINDLVGINAEYPHEAKEDGKIYPHLHWWQTSATDAIVFTLAYRIQKNGSAKETTWTQMTAEALTDSVLPYTSGTMNQITKFKDASNNYYIDLNDMGLSATIQFRLTRTDSVSGDVSGIFFDFHYEKETLGSRQEFVR